MASPRPGAAFHRKLELLERAWPWLGGAAVLAAALAALALGAAGGRLFAGRPDDRVLRGYTPAGVFLGVAALVLGVLSATYSLRKRPLQERLSAGRGKMTAWLWLHVAAGLAALAAAALHAGYGLLGAAPSTGRVLAAIFALLVVSGIAWRLVYHLVPPRAAPRIGNYSERGSELYAEALAVEIDKTLAGGSAELRQIATWLAEAPRDPDEMAASSSALSSHERATAAAVADLEASRRRALGRRDLQARATSVLQGLRVVHVPLALLVVPATIVHVVAALDLHVAAVGPGDAPIEALSGFHPARDCASCHAAIVAAWSTSMHAHALRSPVTIAQNNQLYDAELGAATSPDPRHFCVNCHGPVAEAATGRTRLPLRRDGYGEALLDEGIGCSACHQWRGTEHPGAAGLAAFQKGLRPGSTYFGAIDDPVGNAFHRSRYAGVVARDGALCTNCHSVEYDVDGDGRLDKGVDLVLQTTAEEYAAYAARGGRPTCAGCHMPLVKGQDRAAEGAAVPAEQDVEAPPRVVHDHSFVGVDYPLDEVAFSDPQQRARQELLRSAARLDLEPAGASLKGGALVFAVSIANAGVGHDLPSGFAFARQMWLEVRVTGELGAPIFASGVLARPSDDLCDAGTVDEADNPARPFVVGCKGGDRQLVNFQQKLLDRIAVERDADGRPKRDALGATRAVAAPGAREAWIQHLTAGAVPRVRPIDSAVLSPIAPEETRTFVYRAPAPGAARVTISVRLLFRSLAPYMLRALAAGQAKEETPLAPLVDNLQVVEMARKTITVEAR